LATQSYLPLSAPVRRYDPSQRRNTPFEINLQFGISSIQVF